MALKKKKYPKKPAAKASIATMQKYLDKRKEVDKYNAQLEKDKKTRETLKAKIRKI
jgi:hypothetical protein